MAKNKQQTLEQINKQLSDSLEISNPMRLPRLEKIVINRGLGEATSNSKVVEASQDMLMRITGQKPVVTRSKKAISNFKLRENQAIGVKVTLRRKSMNDFLVKLINVVLPKIRDFRGVPNNSFDGRGNYTLGIKEDGIFPEVDHEAIDRPRGFDITFVTSTDDDGAAFALLKAYGMPFRK